MPAAWRGLGPAGCRKPGVRRHASRRFSSAFPKACEHPLGVVSAPDVDLAGSQTSPCCVGAQLSVGQARANVRALGASADPIDELIAG